MTARRPHGRHPLPRPDRLATGRRRRPDDERGATLILALAFVMIFTLVTVSVLSLATAGLTAARTQAGQGELGYAADGATQLAIDRFAQGNPCAAYTAPPLNGRRMTVHCDPLDSSPETARATRPQDALRALGEGTGDGVEVTAPGLRVQGSVFSRTGITTTGGGSMVVAGDVSAVGNCSRAVTQPRLPASRTPYTRGCADDTPPAPADEAVGTDPDLAPPATAVPVRRTVPACPRSGSGPGSWLVRLLPGSYDDASALGRLTGGDCPGAVVWLQPGLYYFDFGFTGGPALWTVDDPTVSVVGGTPAGWSPEAATRPAVPGPGGCDRTRPEGVQIVMGGASRLQVDRGHAELCAPVTPGAQQVAVYGVQPPKPSHTLRPTRVVTNTGFTEPGQALTGGERPTRPGCPQPTGTEGCTADAALDADRSRTASIQLAGFTPGVPAGSLVTGATLRVRHAESGGLTARDAVTVTTAVGGETCRTDALPRHTELTTDPAIDLLGACGLTDPARLGALTVDYTATLDADGTAATARLDGVWLEVAYRTPTTFKPTGVLASAGFTAPDAALEIGEQPTAAVAGAELSPARPTASATLSGFVLAPLPAGTMVRSVVLRVAHRETGRAAAPRVTVTPAGGGTRCTGLPLPARTDLADDRVDLTACGITGAAQLTGLTATYTAGLDEDGGATGTASLDGAWLEVVHDPPPARPATSAESASFRPAADARAIDGTDTAAAALDAATPTAAIGLGGFDSPAPAPGSAVDRAVLRVAHREDPGTPDGPPPAVTVTLAGPGLPRACATAHPLPARRGALGTDTLDLVALCGITDTAQLTGLAVTYTATLGSGAATGTARLDGVELDLADRPPLSVRPATATGATGPGTAPFAAPEDARTIDAAPATARLGPTAPSASLRLGGYAVPALPAGAAIDRVRLRVAHREDAGTAPKPDPAPPARPRPPAAVLTVSGTGTACDADHALPAREGALGLDVIDLTACGVTAPEQLAALAVTYTATAGDGGGNVDGGEATAGLDGVALDLVFRAPSVRPLSGCLTEGSRCPVLKSTDTADTATDRSRLLVNGTVYAPTGAVDLAMSRVASQVVTRGVVARSIRLGVRPAPGYLRPVVGVPPEPVAFTTYPAVSARPSTATAATGFAAPVPGAPADVTAATLPGGGTASLTLGGYRVPDPAPDGALDHAVLEIAHRESGDVASVQVSAEFAGSTCAGAGALDLPVRLGADAPVADQLDLAPCGLTRAAQLAGLRLTYTVTAGGGGATARLDGTRADLLSRPLLRAAVSFDGRTATVGAWTVLP
ncbi:hypothetical protein [Streptomyces sp. NPDC048659]|uniref:hypothetical protein n=1 Tax=Streptomyces sp. NPDC048659 TaxID=3155489 RepID=UPI00342DA2B7